MQIIAKDLNFTYNKKTPFSSHALNGVNLTINKGDFFGIIGHTGSGKSTFLQHLNGLIKVQEGSLTVGDFDLTQKKCDFKKLRSKVGMVFQYPEYQLFADTVFADVAYGLQNFEPQIKGDELNARVRQAIEIVGLDFDAVKDKSPFDLSGGQKRRVAIAGVIISKPEVLILDEPAAGLDPQGKQEIMALLNKLHKTTCNTIIIVSHDMDEIAQNCTMVAMFVNGQIYACKPPKELFSMHDQLKEAGLGVPVAAEIAYRLKECGIIIDTNFKKDDFVQSVIKYAKDNRLI